MKSNRELFNVKGWPGLGEETAARQADGAKGAPVSFEDFVRALARSGLFELGTCCTMLLL